MTQSERIRELEAENEHLRGVLREWLDWYHSAQQPQESRGTLCGRTFFSLGRREVVVEDD